jgi:TonB family protein
MIVRRATQIVLLNLFLLSIARADNSAALIDRLHQAEASSSLDTGDLKPWHLKLNVQLFGDKSQPTEQGTIEEWWTSPSSYQIAYTFPSYTAVELRSLTGLSRTKDAGTPPSLFNLLLDQVVHPMPGAKDINGSIPDLRKETFGKVPLECIMLDQKIQNVTFPPFGLFPTYCFDPGKPSLRLRYNLGSQMIIRNSVGIFQMRNVATDIRVIENKVDKAAAHVGTLESNSSITPPQIDPTTLVTLGPPAQLAGQIVNGRKVGGANPIYPDGAKSRHASGAVVIDAVIGTDGHIHSMRLSSVPDPELAISALTAVQTWTYTPYLLNGNPTEVETNITVHYNFSLR